MDIHFIKQNIDLVKNNQKNRFQDPQDIDKIMDLYQRWIKLDFMNSEVRRLKNKISKNFKGAQKIKEETFQIDDNTVSNLLSNMSDVDKHLKVLTTVQLSLLAKSCKIIIEENSILSTKLLEDRDKLIREVGNVLHKNVPIDKDENNNGILKEIDNKIYPQVDKPLSHIDILEKLGFVDTENGIKVAGNRGYFFTDMGVKFNRALINYALDFMQKNGYKLMYTPFFIKEELISKISQLTDYQETLYNVDSNKYLIATSEQPLTAYFNNKIYDEKDLPIKMAGISTCFRKETGSHGRNTNGIYRVHQFEKVEQFCVTHPDKSWEMLDEMMSISQKFYDSLGISYRIINIVSGALNNSAAMKYDLEAWFPGSKDYCELVSCTNCTDYFSNRLKTKLNDGTNRYVHMLNCTLCANTRTICAIVETYQTNDGITIPKVLEPYIGGINEIKFKS